MVPRRLLQISVLGLLTSAGVGSASCEKVPLTAPPGTVITLVSATNVLPINGSTELVAVLIENGTTTTGTGNETTTGPSAGTPVHNGTLVTFTTSLGRIEPAEARTHNGRVTVKFSSDGRSGKAVVTAFSGSATKTLEVLIGGAAAERVLVTANPTSLPANGGTSTVTARVEDVSGNPLFGVPVAFTTTAGTLNPVSALTNEAGLAMTSLSATTAATVTASAGGKTGTASLTVRSKSEIDLNVSPTTAPVGSAVTFTVVPDAAVSFRNVVLHYPDGSQEALGAISGSTSRVYFLTEPGVAIARVVGHDVDGGTAEASTSVAATLWGPSLNASPTTAQINTPITFTVRDVPTGVSIDRYEWTFGDNTSDVTDSPSTQKGYATPGVKNVRVRVVPLYGGPRDASTQVTINPPTSGAGAGK